MGTRQHKTKGWVIFAVFCAVLFCMAALRACATKAAPEGCSLKRVRPAQTACFPLGTTAWRVSNAYGWRTAMNGVVIAARRSATYGNYLCLSHSGGQETLYAHLQYLFVRAGEVVQAGQPLGTAGETGRSTGAHLHFELLEQGIRYDAGALLGLP